MELRELGLQCVRFTHVAFVVRVIGSGWPCATLAHVGSCLLWGVAVSFSLVPLFDSSAYERMRRKHNWSYGLFWTGNIALHYLPLLWTPRQIHWYAGFAAAAVHRGYMWLLAAYMNSMYVPLPLAAWVTLGRVAYVTEIVIPLVLFSGRQ